MRTLTPGEQQMVEFSKAWEAEFDGTYVLAWGGKDSKWASVLTRLMRDNELPPDEILQRRQRYFASNEEWCESCKWNFAGFVNNIEKFGHVQRKEKVKRRVGTWHCPTCGLQDSVSTHKCNGKVSDVVQDLTKQFSIDHRCEE